MFTKFLDKQRLEVWNKLGELKESGVLAGGTALAMQLNHRVSYDFDIFSDKEIEERFFVKVRNIFWEYEVVPIVDTRDELTVLLSGDIKLTWLYFPFSKLEEEIKTDSLDIFSVDDLLANKAYAMGRRKTWRDYADIYWSLKNKIIDLDRLVALAERKFDGVFAEKLFLEQLVYFEDVEEKVVDWVGKKVRNEEIKDFLKMIVKKRLER